MDTNRKTNMSWSVVIVALLLFWPVGLFLLYLKGKENTKNRFIFSGRIKIAIAIFSIFFALVGFATEIEDPSDDLLIGIMLIAFFLGIGIFLLRKGIQNINDGKICEKIAYMINYQKIETVQQIADKLQISLDKATYYVSKTMELGLCDEDIECRDEKIINKKHIREKEEKKKKQRVVKCESCGGINHVTEGESTVCDYCGMGITIQK